MMLTQIPRYGLNITSDGKLFTVTAGNRLDLPMEPSPGCIAVNHFAWTHGAEDPRLFWTVRLPAAMLLPMLT